MDSFLFLLQLEPHAEFEVLTCYLLYCRLSYCSANRSNGKNGDNIQRNHMNVKEDTTGKTQESYGLVS